ncbi:MAG: MBL fold metallo-hydrolase [Rhizobacter sp.]|nr:MBL fold metallo-hydrolase [Chlorobiales bacterium]
MKITLLGTGTSQGIPVPLCSCRVCRSGDRRDRRLRTSAVVETDGLSLLIDTSIDFREQMLRSNVQRIDAVLLTHHHFDHLFGLDDIRAFNQATGKAIDIYTSPQCEPEVLSRFGYAFKEGNLKYGLPELRMNIVKEAFEITSTLTSADGAAEGGMLRGQALQVLPVEVGHGRLNIYGFRIKNFAYLTDCKTISEASYRLLENLEVVVIDCLRYTEHPTHANLAETLAHIDRIKPKRAVLIHLSHEVMHAELEARLKTITSANVEVGYDQMQIITD